MKKEPKKLVHFRLYQGIDDIRFLCAPNYLPNDEELITASIENTTCMLCLTELLSIEDTDAVDFERIVIQ